MKTTRSPFTLTFMLAIIMLCQLVPTRGNPDKSFGKESARHYGLEVVVSPFKSTDTHITCDAKLYDLQSNEVLSAPHILAEPGKTAEIESSRLGQKGEVLFKFKLTVLVNKERNELSYDATVVEDDVLCMAHKGLVPFKQ